MSIDCLIDDLFGVVVDFDDELVYQRFARHCADPGEALRAMTDLVSSPELITGVLTLPELHEKLRRQHGLALDPARFEALWGEPYSQPRPGMAQLLTSLSARFPLILLSNVDRYYWQTILSGHPELALFKRLLVSWQLGAANPDPRVFLRAAEAANRSPSVCLFVDDKLENVSAAQELGFQTHHFQGLAGLRRALHEAGVLDAE